MKLAKFFKTMSPPSGE